MKKLLIAMLFVSAPSFAETKMQLCGSLKNLAEQVMELRQANIDKSEIKKAGADNKMFLLMVDEAFKYNIEESTTKKILAGVKFGRDVFSICMDKDK